MCDIRLNLELSHKVEWLVDKMLFGEQGRGMLGPVESVSLEEVSLVDDIGVDKVL